MSSQLLPLRSALAVSMRLLEGLDPVGMTLEHAEDIATFEAADRADRPWARMAF